MNPLSLHDAEYIAYRLAAELLDYNEPMDAFATRYPNKLESCLEQPFATYDGIEFYPSLLEKACLLFYLVIKNHPFTNGNKRMAVMLMIVFLYTNGKVLTVAPDELYNLALLVAKSNHTIEDELQLLVETFADSVINR